MNISDQRIKLDYTNVLKHITKADIDGIMPEIKNAAVMLEKRNGQGSDFLGWIDLPKNISIEELSEINAAAKVIIGNSDAFVVLGIGGSYLGARAVLSALLSSFHNEREFILTEKIPEIYFSGYDISSEYYTDLFDVIKDKKITINVVSKSGTTTETALAFRLIREHMIKKFGEKETKKRIIATTDKAKGSMKKLADEEGYKTFVIPDDVGGRFSVLTPVGLLPIAVGGIDISEIVRGAKDFAVFLKEQDPYKNPSCMYAAIRNILLRKGRTQEILAGFEPNLHYVGEWWKQLYGESEGKNHKGIFPDYLDFTTDLHSMGQWIQDGPRSIFETFLWIEKPKQEVIIPNDKDNIDGMNYIAGKTLNYVNEKAYQGVKLAHLEGGVPNMTVKMPELSPYYLGQLIYFFEYAVAISGYTSGVNPFDQPGVESYKKNMFAFLGKPGFEKEHAELEKASSSQKIYEV